MKELSTFSRIRVGVIVLLLFLGCESLLAKHVEESKALSVAKAYILKNNQKMLRSEVSLSLAYVCKEDAAGLKSATDRVYYYVFNVNKSNGFVLVSGDDCAMPVLGYVDNGSYDPGKENPNFDYWMNEYKNQISFGIEKGIEADSKTKEAWESLLNNKTEGATTSVVLKTANWGQDIPYDSNCPVYNGSKCAVGCGATAMGIIMKYHQWPDKGTGSIAYQTESLKLNVSADFNTAYKWADMLDEYIVDLSTSTAKWTDSQASAVATLLFHCGAASKMDYTVEASYGYIANTAMALVNNFNYDKGIACARRDYYSESEWFALLKSEIDNNRPVLYHGEHKTGGGHAFVADGYNSEGYIHINWGWYGSYNGFYISSALSPDSSDNYSYKQIMALNIKKNEGTASAFNDKLFYLIDKKGISMDETVVIAKNVPFNVNLEGVANNSLIFTFYGYIGVFLVDKNDKLIKSLCVYHYIQGLPPDRYFAPDDFPCTIKQDFSKSDKLQAFYSTDGSYWKKIGGISPTVDELPVDRTYTSLKPVIRQNIISIYPNPVSDILYIRTESDNGIVRVAVYDLLGRSIKSFDGFGDTNVSLPLGDLQNGTYLIKIRTGNGTDIHKIIKH